MRQQGFVPLSVLLLLTLSFAPSLLADADDLQAPAPADVSHARVVTLSFVSGTVIARRPGSRRWSAAKLDTPIEEGVSLATAKNSFAEVQFENGSTLRVGELSRVDFAQLALAPQSGRHISRLTLVVGVATIHVMPKRHDEYILNASGASLTPHGKAEFRTDLNHGHVRVEVLTGRVEAADATQTERLAKNQVLAYDDSSTGDFQVTDSIQVDEFDKWVQARDREASLEAYRDSDGWDASIPFGFGGSMGALTGALGGDSF